MGARSRVPRLHGALLDQLVQVAAHGGGGQLQPLGEVRGRGRAVDEDGPGDTLTRATVRADPVGRLVDFHNISVLLLRHRVQGRSP
jgi:hypothetical protein